MTIPESLKSAVVSVLSSSSALDDLALLATHMKPEGAIRDAIFLSLQRSGVEAAIECRSSRGVSRTDLVVADEAGLPVAVEFKFWVAPDLATPAKIVSAAQKDWEKHQGEVVLVTVISEYRSLKYFTRPTHEHLWRMQLVSGTIAEAVGAPSEWIHSGGGLTVNAVG